MADYKNIDVAIEDLDELIEVLEADIKQGGFDNDGVIWMIKVWTKVTILAGINNNNIKAFWIMKRAPSKITGKRSQVLLRALEDYSNFLEKPGTRSGDFFTRVNDAMLNFVWDYRQHLSSKQEMDFVNQLHRFIGLKTEQLMQEALTKMDQQ